MQAIELFCGAGGVALGLQRAGLDVVRHFDCDADAVATMRAAGYKDVVEEYVQYLELADLLEVLLWWASPPCPAWSSAGKRRGAADGRNGYPHLFRALGLMRKLPRWLLIEQVEGITFHKRDCPTRRGRTGDPNACPACYLSGVILPTLRKFFPVVRGAVLDSADYGVPQTRSRFITVCGPEKVPWPVPTHSATALDRAKETGAYWRAVEDGSLYEGELKIGEDGCRPFRTMRQVLPALRLPEGFAIGGGRHPGAAGEQRVYAELTDRPSTTISAQDGGSAGNLGPFVCLSGTRGGKGPVEMSADRPAPTISTAGDVYELRKKPGRSSRPVQIDRPSPSVSTAGDDILIERRSPIDGQLQYPDSDAWHRVSQPDEPARAIGSKGNASVSFRDDRGNLFYVRGLGRSASEPERLDQPSPTVATTEEKGTRASEASDFDFNGGPDRASDAAFLAVGRRRLEPSECAILQDFPPDWPFQGNKGSVYAQIGNACPATLAEVVAREVLRVDRRLGKSST